REALDSVRLPSDRIVMIGDTPEVDILGAHRAGITALLMGDADTPGEGDFRRPDGRWILRSLRATVPILTEPSLRRN
ncbi:MAG: hypothetical protein EOM65_14530, partial [Synergistales bacterium]|nr:hypothetical protein [Synergistales bacterium]